MDADTGLVLCTTWACAWKWLGGNAANLIAFAALFVSLLAMGATFWQAYIARQHNRLTVRPLLHPRVDRSTTQYKGNVDVGPRCLGRITINVSNVGLGPAVITQVELYVRGAKIPEGRMELIEAAFMPVVAVPITQISKFQTFTFQTCTALPQNATIVFLDLEVLLQDDAAFRALDNRIRNETRLVMRYKSASYPENFVFDTDTY